MPGLCHIKDLFGRVSHFVESIPPSTSAKIVLCKQFFLVPVYMTSYNLGAEIHYEIFPHFRRSIWFVEICFFISAYFKRCDIPSVNSITVIVNFVHYFLSVVNI